MPSKSACLSRSRRISILIGAGLLCVAAIPAGISAREPRQPAASASTHPSSSEARPPAFRAGKGQPPLPPATFPVAGLDSLASGTLERALDLLEMRPAELGFDKLYADDDTFRLGVVEEILNDPLRLPGWQAATVWKIRQRLGDPAGLAALLGALMEASDGSEDNLAPPVTPPGFKGKKPDPLDLLKPRPQFATLLRSVDAGRSPWPGDLQPAVDAFIRRCTEAEASLNEAFAGLTPLDRTRILTLAPAFWGDPDDPEDKLRKGRLHAEVGVACDTTLKLNEDRILDAAVHLDRQALTRATREFYSAVIDLALAVGKPAAGTAVPAGTTTPGSPAGAATPVGTATPGSPAGTIAGAAASEGMTLPGVTGSITAVYNTPWGLLVIGGTGDNAYSAEALRKIAFIIEPGGNDTYRGRVASAVGGLIRPFSAVVDLDGDDVYDSQGLTYAVGGAVLGLSALIDLHGNDIYKGDDGCCGAGFFGSGLLYDGGGSDLFQGRNLCEGAGAFGIGLLVSEADSIPPPGPPPEEDRGYTLGLVKVPDTGALPIRYDDNDTYLAARQSQGFASTYGIGLLYDRTGNDVYRSSGRYLHRPLLPNDFQSLSQGFSIGFRPRAGGGIGLLIDEEGNDFYDAEVYAQGASYWYSLGLLFDGGGNDRYLATQYAQGAGIHLSIGSLWDRGGDDHYMCKFGVTQGTAHDLSVGMLLDESGNDYYAVSDGQGMSITNSTAIFIDEQGDDVYATPGIGQGTVTWARGFAGAGIFLDLAGNDTYPEKSPGRNGGIWQPYPYAIGIDLPRTVVLPEQVIPPIVLTAADSARKVEELFDTASLWDVGDARERVQRARKALLTKPHEAMLFGVAKRLDTQDGLVYPVLLDVGQAQPDSFAARIIPRLRDPDQFVQRNVISLLGEMKRKDARIPMESMLVDRAQEKHWARLISALGNIGDPAARPAVRPFLHDAKERRRLASTVALAALKDTLSIPDLVLLLDDPMLTVRSAAYTALGAFGAEAVEPLVARLQDAGAPARPVAHRSLLVRTLGQITCAIPDTAGAQALAARAVGRKALMAELDRAAGSMAGSGGPADSAPDRPAASAPARAWTEYQRQEAARTSEASGSISGARAAAVEALLKLGDPETIEFVRLHMRDETDPLVLRTFRNALPKPPDPTAGR